MKLSGKIMLAAATVCMMFGVTALAAACNGENADPVSVTYAVTYAFGKCGDTAYVGNSVLPTESDKEAGATFELAAAPVWDGYTFEGWNDGTTTYDAEAEYTMPAKAVTLTAQWEKIPDPTPETYAVTYAFGKCGDTAYAGNSVLPTESDKEEGATFELAAAPVWDGYTFEGWNDGTETYDAETEYTMPAHAVTLTAQWEKVPDPTPETYAVTYAFGTCGDTAYAGNSALPTESDKEAGATFELAAAPVWEGYIFKGWNDGTETYDAEADYTMPAKAVTLTAQWEKEPPAKYAITYAFGKCGDTAYAGSSALPTVSDKEAGATFELAAAPVWDGYIFKGWNDGAATYDAEAEYTMPAHAVTLTAQWEKELPAKYAVTYAFGKCGDTAYAGNSALPTVSDKEEGATFELAAAPVWDGYTFEGWNDGTATYNAEAEYTMPAKAVTLTAQWEPVPHVKDTNIDVPAWEEGATEGGYRILKGQHVTISASVNKETSDSAYGINAKIFPNSVADNNSFYQCRCDFIVKRTNWSWNETNDGFTVSDGGWNRDTYRETWSGETTVTVALSTDGVLTYTFAFTSDEYSHNRVFTDTAKMNSALVIFGADHCVAENACIEYPFENAIELSIDYGDRVDCRHFRTGDSYTFGSAPFKAGFEFLGWQADGAGDYYASGDTYTVGDSDVSFTAAWRAGITIQFDRDGGAERANFTYPTRKYNDETGKYDIGGLPGFNQYQLEKKGYKFAGWEVSVNGEAIEVNGPFSVEPGSKIVYKIVWAKTYYVSYGMGKCGDKNYGGYSAVPQTAYFAEGEQFALADAPVWGGYEFLGWNDGENTLAAGSDYTMPATDVKLTAQWKELQHYTVTFVGGEYEGTPYGGQTKIDTRNDSWEGATFQIARAIKWGGYEFLGWDDGTGTLYQGNAEFTMPAHDVVFTAKWKKIPTHTVTYQSGSEQDDVTCMPEETTYYEGQILMEIPVRAGYTFTGWRCGEKVYQAGDALDLKEDGVSLEAAWEALSEENAAMDTLSGIWAYESGSGTEYLRISGMTVAWDAFKTSGTYKAGAYTKFTATASKIEFRFQGVRPAEGGSKSFTCTYDVATDTIDAGTYGTFTRLTEKAADGASSAEQSAAAQAAAALPAATAVADVKRIAR